MSDNQNYPEYPESAFQDKEFAQQQISFINKVYGTMTLGLLLTTAVSYLVYSRMSIDTLTKVVVPCCVAELILVIVLSWFVQSMPVLLAFPLFIVYAALNGVSLTTVLYVYHITSVTQIFLTTSLVFGAMSVYGCVTRRDLTTFGHFAFMALLGVIIASLVNLFFHSTMVDMILSVLGVFIFVGLTAYDTQKIKQIHEAGINHTGIAIIGALKLYLDFINMFLYLLRLFGKRK